ncbi:MAG: DUF3990 domain-containing protein [Eubacteriales bacterium]|nr:DUF3990 domain-containing protein [Eubacteriales bacterium]
MKLYHGSNIEVMIPKLIPSKRLLDFGAGVVISGPVANDQAIRTVNNYLKGYFSEDVAIKLLLPQKLKDQYVFRTERSLHILKYLEVKSI